ncbi:MAG TPA: hypothetical protein VHE83_12855 [Mycobacteriales bacterium]|nr:hypothetical protein [Mycobacteriales bacterium]
MDRTTLVKAARPDVSSRIGSPAGINDELSPLLKMTVPRTLLGRRLASARRDQRCGAFKPKASGGHRFCLARGSDIAGSRFLLWHSKNSSVNLLTSGWIERMFDLCGR